MKIKDYGWNEYFERDWNQRATEGMFPGRVVADYGQQLRVVSDFGEVMVSRPHQYQNQNLQVAVGDWVGLLPIEDSHTFQMSLVLNRKSKFSRAASGIEVKEQLVAANVDTVFLVQSLNRDFNMRRLERYLIGAWESGATPVVVLTKADCCEDIMKKIEIVHQTAPGVAVHAISCITGMGLEEIEAYLTEGKTVAILGSSGVGKSTLVNTLAGEALLKTQDIRETDSRGRHTTTHRELVLLPKGGMVLDTPGMRTLILWEADTGMETLFGDIEVLTKMCRFHDCSHQTEPGCAVKEALANGSLTETRWNSWQKLQKELVHFESRKNHKLRLLEKQRSKQMGKHIKEIKKNR